MRVQEILDALDTIYREDPEYLPEAMSLLNREELSELAFAFARRAGISGMELDHVSASTIADEVF